MNIEGGGAAVTMEEEVWLPFHRHTPGPTRVPNQVIADQLNLNVGVT